MKKLLLIFLPLILYSQVIDTIIRFSDQPIDLLYIEQENELYINFGVHNYLSVLDCSTYQIKKNIPTGGDYPSTAYGVFNSRRNKIDYTFKNCPDSVAVIDNQTDSIVKWINYRAYFSPCYNSGNDRIYVTNGYTIAVIECGNDSIIKIISHPDLNLTGFVLWDSISNKIYCGSSWGDKVIAIDCMTDSIVAIISTRLGTPYGAAYNYQRKKIYVGGEWGRGCAVIDAVKDTLVKFLNIWYYEVPPIWNSIEDKVYWPSGDSLCVLDCQNDSIIKWFVFGSGPMYLVNWSNHLFVFSDTWTSGWEGHLNIIDCHTDSLISQLRIGSHSEAITYDSPHRLIYVSTMGDSSLYVIRDEVPGIEERSTFNIECLTPEIYPNPAKGVIRVRCPISVKTIKIFDVSGKLVGEIATPTARNDRVIETKISLKGISPGIYFLRMGMETKKFLVVK
jgi:DNA-binding beta-propeller fold protein YncE